MAPSWTSGSWSGTPSARPSRTNFSGGWAMRSGVGVTTVETDGGFVRLSGVEAQVARELAARQQLGIRKYGGTLAENQAAVIQRLQHLKEELMDGALYCQWAINQLTLEADDGR